MKVKEFIAKLKKLPPNMEVIMSDYYEPDKEFAFAHIKTVRVETIGVGNEDKDYVLIYSGDWVE